MKKKQAKRETSFLIIPLLLIAAFVPLVVHLKLIPIDAISFKFWIGDKQNADFFSYYKAIFTVILAAASLVVFVIARLNNIIETRKLLIYYFPIAVYTVMIVLSTTLSHYPITARQGFIDRYEGAYVLISYMVILFTTINLVNNINLLKVMVLGLFISATGVSLIGIFQFYGLDLFKSDFGKLFILPEEYRSLNLSFTFGPHTIYSTLYNTNFVGSFMAMLLPLASAAFLYSKDIKYKIISGAFTCLVFSNWLGCRSRGGYVGGAIAVLVLIIFLRKRIIQNIKSSIILFISIILIFIGMNYSANGELGGRIFTSLSNIEDYTASNGGKAIKPQLLNDIIFGDKKVSIVYGSDTLNMGLEGTQLIFTDTNGKQLPVGKDASGNITINDSRYSSYNLVFDNTTNTLDIKLASMKFSLFVEANGFKIIGERGILLDRIDHPQTFGFTNREKFASMRGYIWSRSIPLLKNNLLVGGGPDTYAMQFPQHDYVGKLRAFDMVNEIIDKPHNMYLQVGINTGVVSLLAVMFLLAVYLISSLKLYFRKEDSGTRIIGIALFVAVLGYSVSALANDSLVSVAPTFWVILGLGISSNYIFENGNDKEKDSVIKPIQAKNKGASNKR